VPLCGDLLSYWVPVLCPVVLVFVLLFCLWVAVCVLLSTRNETLYVFHVLSLVVLAWALCLNGSFTELTIIKTIKIVVPDISLLYFITTMSHLLYSAYEMHCRKFIQQLKKVNHFKCLSIAINQHTP